jgi:hypothetical protein
VLDDPAVSDAEEIRGGEARIARPADHVRVHGHHVAIDQRALDVLAGVGRFLAHAVEEGLEMLDAWRRQRAVLDVVPRDVAVHLARVHGDEHLVVPLEDKIERLLLLGRAGHVTSP